jgi:hypothetical protein
LEALVVGIMFVYRTVKVKHLKRNEEFKTPAPAYIYRRTLVSASR